jgi:hypothetical protein
MISTTWTITNLERNIPDGAVYIADWRVVSVDGNYSASTSGTNGFLPDPLSPNFVPYDQLTEGEVLSWVWANGVDKFTIEASLANQIYLQQNPVTASGLPW